MNTPKIISKFNLTVLVIAVLTITNIKSEDKRTTNSSSSKDLITAAIEAGTFTTLATALKEADLVSTLQGEGPFTVFAPTDDAFAKLPKGTLESLLKDKDALKKILLYHVVAGKIESKDVVKMNKATTVAGEDIIIKVNDGKVMINDSNVIAADVMASNGIIHVIDTVLIP